MANIVKNTDAAERKRNKQNNRQSKDFNEIWNIQTECNVSDEQWDRIFHNYEHPELCNQDKKPRGCTICDQLRKEGKLPPK